MKSEESVFSMVEEKTEELGIQMSDLVGCLVKVRMVDKTITESKDKKPILNLTFEREGDEILYKVGIIGKSVIESYLKKGIPDRKTTPPTIYFQIPESKLIHQEKPVWINFPLE